MVSSRCDASLGQVTLKSVYLLLPNAPSWSLNNWVEDVEYDLKDLVAGGLLLRVSMSNEGSFCQIPAEAGLIHWEDGYIP